MSNHNIEGQILFIHLSILSISAETVPDHLLSRYVFLPILPGPFSLLMGTRGAIHYGALPWRRAGGGAELSGRGPGTGQDAWQRGGPEEGSEGGWGRVAGVFERDRGGAV
jgi:hypothetical protein